MNSLLSDYQQISKQNNPPVFFNDNINQFITSLAMVKNDAEEMLKVLFDFFSTRQLGLNDFEYKKGGYSRTILYREKSGFEVMVARWARGSSTPIHGHPDFSLCYLIQGGVKETVFYKEEKRILQGGVSIQTPGDYSYHYGEEGGFDNAIHKIEALRDSLSLHIYSDDAMKGQIYGVHHV